MDGIPEFIKVIKELIEHIRPSPHYFKETFTGPDTTDRHPVEFIDIHTGVRFKSRSIRIRTPPGNTGNVEYSFTETGEMETLARGNTFIMDNKEESRIYLKFANTNDTFQTTAW